MTMTSAKIYFFFDIQTLKIVGHFIYEGTVSDVYVSEDRKNIVFEMENYRPIPWGDLIPTQDGRLLKVEISEIKRRGCVVGVVGAEVDYPCNPSIVREELMKAKIVEILNRVRGEFMQQEQQKKEKKPKDTPVIMPILVSNKWKS